MNAPAKTTMPATWLLLLLLTLALTPMVHANDSDSLLGPPPGKYRLLSEDAEIRIPFEIYRGDIRYQGKVNGRDVHLLLDDGFMWDQLLFWGGPAADSLGLEYDGYIGVGGSTDESENLRSRTASGITLSFPGLEFTEQTAVITPASSGNASMWAGSIGQVSATFFKHFVVDINFDDMIITLIPPERFEYTGKGVAVPWEPSGIGPWKIPGTLGLEDGRKIALGFIMDLGLNSQLRLAAGGEHNITLPQNCLPTGLGRNIQGVETRGCNGRLKSAAIGGYEVKSVLCGFVAEEHGSHTLGEAMVGLGLLSRFNLTFDFYNKRLFVEPNGSTDDPYELDMTGMSMRPGSGDFFEITRIHPNSPASEAGLEVGHEVHKINGRAVNDYDVFELRPILRREGTTVTLEVERNGVRETIELVLRRLI